MSSFGSADLASFLHRRNRTITGEARRDQAPRVDARDVGACVRARECAHACESGAERSQYLEFTQLTTGVETLGRFCQAYALYDAVQARGARTKKRDDARVLVRV
eukprot:5737812-Pleurochrysis_carterae.AAC.1